ncbi:glucose 1-dehydrogenase [Caballeronia sp. LjRoot29]|uniref:glucose 1-dehydrogenase n=1 Tax=Caballeronia sp. LjRoot29 TaxID=3342315 RepID=UPI003ECD5218
MAKQVVLITGALTGIGHATAVAYAKLGAKIVVSGRHENAGAKVRVELEALGAEAEFIKADVRAEEDVRSLVAATLKRFGRLDVAVNNAGTEGEQGHIPGQTVENFHITFDTNVLGTLLCLKYELPIMLKQRSGSIINISSIAGKVGFAGASVYVASKHAVNGLTKSAALEAAPSGVRVNAIAPGPVQTDMMERFVGRDVDTRSSFLNSVPAGRAGTTEEIADAIVFLGSDKAAYFNGQSILVDGGYTTQ